MERDDGGPVMKQILALLREARTGRKELRRELAEQAAATRRQREEAEEIARFWNEEFGTNMMKCVAASTEPSTRLEQAVAVAAGGRRVRWSPKLMIDFAARPTSPMVPPRMKQYL